ncbi:MAG: YcxB family protein [Anaerolineales bacterium]
MEIVYTDTVDDLVAFHLYYYDHDRGQRALQTLVSLIPAIIVLVFVVLQSRQGRTPVMGLVGVAVAVLLTVGMRRFLRKRMAETARRAYAQGRAKRTLGRHQLKLTDEGLVEIAGKETYTTPWSAITQVAETADAVYIYCGRTAGMVIPRARVRQGDLAAFVEAVRAHL